MKKFLMSAALIALCVGHAEANAISGNYSMVGTDECLLATSFSSSLVPSTPSNTFHQIVDGYVSFDGAGSGKVTLSSIAALDTRVGAPLPAASSASFSQGTISFTYVVDSDHDEFTVTETSNTGTFTAGASTGQTYTINGVPPWAGSISGGSGRNHQLVMVSTQPVVESVAMSGGSTLQAVCARWRLLQKTDADDTN